MAAILMMSSRLATQSLFQRKVFRNKGYDVIKYVHDVSNKVLSQESNHIADAIMLDNSSISVREVVINSIL